MAISLTTMPLSIGGETLRPMANALEPCTSTPAADAEACRLAAAVGRGDETAFRKLYDDHRERVFRLALVLGHGDETLAHDTVQAVFLTAARKLRRVENEEHLWNWLARVARQHLGKAWRQRQHESGVTVTNEIPDSPRPDAADSAMEENLDAALSLLDPEERRLIELFYFDGLGHKEIAEQLNATTKAISSRLERARARLRALVTKGLSRET